jgi:flagellar biogenesis protein FliO
MIGKADGRAAWATVPRGGLAGWLLERLRGTRRAPPRLAVLERIALAPRQSLALVEADGRRFLVATSPEGAPAFYALDAPARANLARRPTGNGHAADRPAADRAARVSC